MRNLIIAVSTFFVLLMFAPSFAEINIDVTGARIDVQNSSTIRLHNVFAPGSPQYTGKYWLDLQWDPVNLVFVPVNLGEEPNISKTWIITYADESGSAEIRLSADPINRVIHEHITGLTGVIGNPCLTEKIVQNNKSFEVGNQPGWGVYSGQEADVTLYYCEGYEGCWSNGFIGKPFPIWFDFNAPFTLVCNVNASSVVESWFLK